VGVGEMGRPVVDRVLHQHQVAAFVRRPELRAELTAAGVEVVDSISALGAERDVVIVFVYSDPQVREVALDGGLVDAMDPGSVLVVHTTGSPTTVELIAQRATPRGVGVVDAPVSGPPSAIVAGHITLLVGGDAKDLARCRPVLDAYAEPVLHLGALGSGQRVKLINNVMFGAHIQLAIEATRLGRAFGIDAKTLAETLGHCSAASYVLNLLATVGSPEELISLAGHFVYKDVTVASAVARQLGSDLGLLQTVTDPLLELTKPSP